MGSKQYYAYIMANYDRKVIYIGITNDLVRRVYEHKNKLADGFTNKYNTQYLMFYEMYQDPESATEREKQIKSWNRKRKNELIMKFNPKWQDLYFKILN